jgi:membrane-bound lytic murein transglycosylase C
MKKNIIPVLLLFAVSLYGQRTMQDDMDEYQRYLEQDQQAFSDFQKKDLEAFEAYKKKVEKEWGDFVASSRKDWVEYSDDLQNRSKVDFEKGEVVIEILVDKKDAKNEQVIRQKLEKAVEHVATTKGKAQDYPGQTAQNVPVTPKPILHDQLKTPSGQKVTPQNAKTFASEVVKKETVKPLPVKGNDDKVKVRISLALAPDHIQTRAKDYVPAVRKYSTKYNVDPALVLAVIHTESHFNPKARSHIPAYGLMQLVPWSAAKDVNRFLYNKDEDVAAGVLYNPERNIEFGVAYIHILQTRYFKNVTNPVVKNYCTISAYNAGAGNVSRAFTGNTNLPKAVPVINTYTPDRAYNQLKNKMSTEEARNYIQKVSKLHEQYKSWI